MKSHGKNYYAIIKTYYRGSLSISATNVIVILMHSVWNIIQSIIRAAGLPKPQKALRKHSYFPMVLKRAMYFGY